MVAAYELTAEYPCDESVVGPCMNPHHHIVHDFSWDSLAVYIWTNAMDIDINIKYSLC